MLVKLYHKYLNNNELTSDSSLRQNNEFFESESYSEILNHQDPKVLYLHKEFDAQGRSPHEANIVAELVNDLISNGVDFEDIGIMTPYRAQVREIKNAIKRKVNERRLRRLKE